MNPQYRLGGSHERLVRLQGRQAVVADSKRDYFDSMCDTIQLWLILDMCTNDGSDMRAMCPRNATQAVSSRVSWVQPFEDQGIRLA